MSSRNSQRDPNSATLQSIEEELITERDRGNSRMSHGVSNGGDLTADVGHDADPHDEATFQPP